MSEPDRGHAVLDQVVGGIKQAAGTVLFNEDIKTDGKNQSQKGDKEYQAAQAEDKAKSVGNNVSGTVKEGVGKVFSDDLKEEGQKEQVKADVQDEASKH